METSHEALLSLIRSLPKEIRDMILKALLRALLQPGRVFPGNPDDNEKVSSNALAIRPGVVEALQIPEASMVRLARDIFYTQNTWVVKEGPLSTIEWLIKPSMPVIFDISRIISVEFSFSCQDTEITLEDRDDFFRRKRQPWYSRLWKGSSAHRAQIQQAYSQLVLEYVISLEDCWWTKFGMISRLPLHHLTLDFRKCWDARGIFRGFEVVTSPSTMVFRHGLPPHLEIVAHDPTVEAHLLWHIQQWNLNLPPIVTVCSFCVDGLHPTD
ncbi:hypothetical protein MMC18_005927 [Xylographa bjoerkii]|nr:hypothetical protein [Xylographa bjoerkii]